jgi:hypothetical protein
MISRLCTRPEPVAPARRNRLMSLHFRHGGGGWDMQ